MEVEAVVLGYLLLALEVVGEVLRRRILIVQVWVRVLIVVNREKRIGNIGCSVGIFNRRNASKFLRYLGKTDMAL